MPTDDLDWQHLVALKDRVIEELDELQIAYEVAAWPPDYWRCLRHAAGVEGLGALWQRDVARAHRIRLIEAGVPA